MKMIKKEECHGMPVQSSNTEGTAMDYLLPHGPALDSQFCNPPIPIIIQQESYT